MKPLTNIFSYAVTWFFITALFVSFAIVSDTRKFQLLFIFWALVSGICFLWRAMVNHPDY